jgi:hypothetical protein
MEMNPHRRRGVRNKRAELVHRPDRDVDPGGCRRLGVDPGGCSQVRIDTANPAARNAEASATLVVPSHPAPAATAALATVTAPWP